MTLQLEIISPEKTILSDQVDEVVVPTTTGQITVLPGHMPLISLLSEGELLVNKNGKETSIVVSGGYIEVGKNNVSILTNYAIRSEEIELAEAQAAKEKAEKIMQEKVSQEDFAQAQAAFGRAILELKIAEKRRGKRHPTTPTP